MTACKHEKISYHALKRMKERSKKKATAVPFIVNAMDNGQTIKDFKPNTKEHSYLEHQTYKRNKKYNDPNGFSMFYQSFIFIVSSDGKCVTVFNAPNWFNKKSHYDNKTKIKNVKKYQKFTDTYNYKTA